MPSQIVRGYQCTLTLNGGTQAQVGDVSFNRTANAAEANSRAGAGYVGVVSGLRRWQLTAKVVGALSLSEGDLVQVALTGAPVGGGSTPASKTLPSSGYGIVTAVNETQNMGEAVTQDITIEGPAAYV